jgi:UDP:flavonoid glycosyltransferase YjiC (YdhE family)
MSNLPPNFEPADTLPTLFVGPDGTIEYPSIIPPHVEFPRATPNGTIVLGPEGLSGGRRLSELSSSQRPKVVSTPSPSGQLQPSNLVSAAPRGGVGPGGPENPPETYLNHRPSPVRRWRTAEPGLVRNVRVPTGRRATEGVGPTGEAWATTEDSGYTSTSSSTSSESSSDEEKEPQRAIAKPLRWTPFGRKRTESVPQRPKGTSTDPKSRSQYRKFNLRNDKYKSSGKVSKNDGRLEISMSDTNNTGYLAKALGATFQRHAGQDQEPAPSMFSSGGTEFSSRRKPLATCLEWSFLKKQKPLSLNIVIMVIGSRGDIQPFLKLGKVLKENYGHRVRIATHPAFREFVENDSSLEFFSVGGDPAELMAFMVKNPGMIPTMETLKKGEVGRRRDAMAQMFEGFWRACINATEDEYDVHNLNMMTTKGPFIADAIIANPPSFAHIHCAERLGIPLHLMFTFPYTPTIAFPHPLANIKKTNVDPGYTNFISYPLVEMMTWQGLGDLMNDFRVKTLGLEPVSTLWEAGQLYRLRVPYTYLWSPGLVPKPKDWGLEISIAGFVFLDLASSFDPPEALVEFLDAGEPPIYIGFGSIVVDDPNKFTQMIYEAVEIAGVRALVSKGWGGFGGDDSPKNVFLLENTPHDWLFPKVRAVVHHGGAGTTAIGLKCGKPTLIVPFFGDQFFWGNMIGKAGVGAQPIPYKELTAEKLAHGIKQLLKSKSQQHADEIAKSIEEEGDGAQNAVETFQRGLTIRNEQSLRCSFLDERLAVWTLKKTNLRLSALAADFLVASKKIRWKQLRLLRHVEWNDFEGPGEPVTGVATSILGNLTSAATGLASIPFKLAQSSKRRKLHEEKKERKERRAAAKERKALAKQKQRQVQIRREQNGSIENIGNTNRGHLQNQQADDLEATVSRRDLLPSNEIPNMMVSRQGSIATEYIQGGRPLEPQTGGEQYLTDDDESALSAEHSRGYAKEIAGDIGGGLKKSGGALIKSKSPNHSI